MPTNGFGNGFSLFDTLFEKSDDDGLPGENNGRDECDRRTGELIALRTAFRALLRSGDLVEVAEEFAEGFSEGKRNLEPALIAKAQRGGPRAVVRYRSFSEATDEIIKRLRAIGRRGR